jgi:hypothetical protein
MLRQLAKRPGGLPPESAKRLAVLERRHFEEVEAAKLARSQGRTYRRPPFWAGSPVPGGAGLGLPKAVPGAGCSAPERLWRLRRKVRELNRVHREAIIRNYEVRAEGALLEEFLWVITELETVLGLPPMP